jgi:hypothetical protein
MEDLLETPKQDKWLMEELFGPETAKQKSPETPEQKKKRNKPTNRRLFDDMTDDDGTPEKRQKSPGWFAKKPDKSSSSGLNNESNHHWSPDGKTPSGPRKSGRPAKLTQKMKDHLASRRAPGTRNISDREYAKKLGFPLPAKTAKEKRKTFARIEDNLKHKKQMRAAARAANMHALRTPTKRDPKTGEFISAKKGINWAPMSPMKKFAKKHKPLSMQSLFGS